MGMLRLSRVDRAASAEPGSQERDDTPRYAKPSNPMCHERVCALHADVSSAAAEIYAASTAGPRITKSRGLGME